jgi:hypothetical protein
MQIVRSPGLFIRSRLNIAQGAAFTSGVILMLKAWNTKPASSTSITPNEIDDVRTCISVLKSIAPMYVRDTFFFFQTPIWIPSGLALPVNYRRS